MRKFLERLFEHLPLQFRILCRQFLLRVVDLEALSIEADIPRFLGQFAGVLIMISIVNFISASMFLLSMTWRIEQYLIATMMLVAGLIVVSAPWGAAYSDAPQPPTLAEREALSLLDKPAIRAPEGWRWCGFRNADGARLLSRLQELSVTLF